MISNLKYLERMMLLTKDEHKELCDVVHDSIIEKMYDENPEYNPSQTEIMNVISELPKDILLDACKWGASDTLVREQIYEFVMRIKDEI